MPLAGNIAFSSLLAFFPFLIFLTALAGFLGNEQLAQKAVEYLLSVAPQEIVAPLVDDVHAILTKPNKRVLTLSIALTLYVAAGGVESVRTGLNRAYGYTDRRIWIVRFIQNIMFVVGGAAVLLALAVLIVFAPLWWDKAETWYEPLSQFSGLFQWMRYPVSLGLMLLALVLGHFFLPVKRRKLKALLPGISITMGLWLLAAWTYTEYTARFSKVQIMYAGLGNVVIALVFVYISAVLVILGGEINQSLMARKAALEAEANKQGES